MKLIHVLRACMLTFVVLVSMNQTNAQQDQATYSDTVFLKNGDTIVCRIVKADRYSLQYYTPFKDRSRYGNMSYKRIFRISTQDSLVGNASVLQRFFFTVAQNSDQKPNHNVYTDMAGKELILFTNEFYTGTVVQIVGGALVVIGTSTTMPIVVIGGGVVAVVGGIIVLSSYLHIRKAGEHLERAASINQ